MLACFFRLTFYHKFQRSAFKYFTKHIKTRGGLPSECSICDPKQRRLKLNHTWQLVYVFVQAISTTDHDIYTNFAAVYLQMVCKVEVVGVASGPCTNYAPEIQLTICLVHACVAIIAAWLKVTNHVAIRGLCIVLLAQARPMMLKYLLLSTCYVNWGKPKQPHTSLA